MGVTFQKSYNQVSYLKALIMQYVDFKIYIVWYTKQSIFTLFPNVKEYIKIFSNLVSKIKKKGQVFLKY